MDGQITRRKKIIALSAGIDKMKDNNLKLEKFSSLRDPKKGDIPRKPIKRVKKNTPKQKNKDKYDLKKASQK